MYKLIVTNSSGRSLRLSQNGAYEILDIEGLTPPVATINSSPIGGADGALFNSSRMEVRNIVITVAPNFPVEANRISLYTIFRVKDLVTLRYTTDSRDVIIEGYVENVTGNQFSKRQTLQISILCLQPYFKCAEEIINDLSQVLSLFEFPFTTESEGVVFSEIDYVQRTVITNSGEANIGLIIEMNAVGEVINPIIYNATDLTSIQLDFKMERGDTIIINTNRSQKSITLFRDAIEYNILNYTRGALSWFDVPPGETVFAYDAESGAANLLIQFRSQTLYQGV